MSGFGTSGVTPLSIYTVQFALTITGSANPESFIEANILSNSEVVVSSASNITVLQQLGNVFVFQATFNTYYTMGDVGESLVRPWRGFSLLGHRVLILHFQSKFL